MKLTASALPFAPYIHKSVIIAPLLVPAMLVICVFLHLSALVSKCRGRGRWRGVWLFKTFKFICVSCETLYRCHQPPPPHPNQPPEEEWHAHWYVHMHSHIYSQVSSKDCRGPLFHLTHFIPRTEQTNSGLFRVFFHVCCKVPTLFQGGFVTGGL